MSTFRTVHDSMGKITIPTDSLYGAQTGRALQNFQISDLTLPFDFIKALALIKYGCAHSNQQRQLLDVDRAQAIQQAALEIIDGKYQEQFNIDLFQTGSGTSSNMNVNEVIARLASEKCKDTVHANDHVNMGQSSNDVIPAAIHLSTELALSHKLLPALDHLRDTIVTKAEATAAIITTGRTHLMDALPISYGQILGGWAEQIHLNSQRIAGCRSRLQQLPLGGTAIGTGVNAHPKLAEDVTDWLGEYTGLPFCPMDNPFTGISAQDTAVELSGQLKTTAVSLMKICNDLRWMNSGPLSGLGEISLPGLQPGSSIMPGKINPVIPEAVAMLAAQVMGNDTTITVAGQSGNFQLNVMLPVIAFNLLQSIELLTGGCHHLADKAIAGFTVNTEQIKQNLATNPILATNLNSKIGYELVAKIVQEAYEKKQPILDVALEMTDLSRDVLEQLLDPQNLIHSHLNHPEDSL